MYGYYAKYPISIHTTEHRVLRILSSTSMSYGCRCCCYYCPLAPLPGLRPQGDLNGNGLRKPPSFAFAPPVPPPLSSIQPCHWQLSLEETQISGRASRPLPIVFLALFFNFFLIFCHLPTSVVVSFLLPYFHYFLEVAPCPSPIRHCIVSFQPLHLIVGVVSRKGRFDSRIVQLIALHCILLSIPSHYPIQLVSLLVGNRSIRC